MSYENCLDCPAHDVQRDPDPDDWFCYDDVKIQCIHTKKYVTVACRPTSMRRECKTPEWCPLKK